uniref:Uncharacterized protein n=1 Tax=Plectus sambesii TaxID=2011161 RepID=A0A914WLA2_9BILA
MYHSIVLVLLNVALLSRAVCCQTLDEGGDEVNVVVIQLLPAGSDDVYSNDEANSFETPKEMYISPERKRTIGALDTLLKKPVFNFRKLFRQE